MNHSTSKSMLHLLDCFLVAKWLSAGLGVGVLGWCWGNSPISGWALAVASRFNAVLLLLVGAMVVLALLARVPLPRVRLMAYGDFRNLQEWTLPGLTRASSVLFGMAIVATLCWAVTGSDKALWSAILGGLIAAVLAGFWYALLVLADDLAMRQ